MKNAKKLPPLVFDPKNVRKGETLEDCLFRLQIEYLRSKIDPKVFRGGRKKQ